MNILHSLTMYRCCTHTYPQTYTDMTCKVLVLALLGGGAALKSPACLPSLPLINVKKMSEERLGL